MCSPSTSAKVNHLVMRYLHFWGVRGDLQEGNGYASRAQNRGFCALLAFETLIFGRFCLSLKKVDSLNTSYYVYLSNDTKR